MFRSRSAKQNPASYHRVYSLERGAAKGDAALTCKFIANITDVFAKCKLFEENFKFFKSNKAKSCKILKLCFHLCCKKEDCCCCTEQ